MYIRSLNQKPKKIMSRLVTAPWAPLEGWMILYVPGLPNLVLAKPVLVVTRIISSST